MVSMDRIVRRSVWVSVWRVIDLTEQVYLFGGVGSGTKMVAMVGFCMVSEEWVWAVVGLGMSGLGVRAGCVAGVVLVVAVLPILLQ